MKSREFLVKAAFLAMAFGLVAAPVLAAEFVKPVEDDPNVVISVSQSYKDLYTAGANVTINGDVTGDLTAAGGMVLVTGKVEHELLLAGGTLQVSGPVGGHARLTGGNVSVSGPIGGDLIVGGGNINLTGSTGVSGDLIIAGGNVTINLPVKGSVRIVAGTVTINSKIEGRVYARAGKLIFGSSAEVAKGVEYKGEQQAVVAQGAKIGEIHFTQIEKKHFGGKLLGVFTFGFLIKLLALMLASFLLIRFKKNFVHSIVANSKARPWENLAWGLLTVIVAPILVILLLFTLVGFYVAAVLALLYGLLIVVSCLLSVLVLGLGILARLNKPGEAAKDWQAVLIGSVAWTLLGLIPFLGWLVIAVIFLIVVGTCVKTLKSQHN